MYFHCSNDDLSPPSVIIIDAVMSFSFSIFFLSPFRWPEPFKIKERPDDALRTKIVTLEDGLPSGKKAIRQESRRINQTTRGVLFYFFGPSYVSFELCTSEREEDKEKAN
jgi:hypothetical protein